MSKNTRKKQEISWPEDFLDHYMHHNEHLIKDYPAMVANLKKNWDFIMQTLTPREEAVINYHWKDGLTLEEIGIKLNVTRERARQIEVKALARLRHPARWNMILGVHDLLEEKRNLQQELTDSIEELKRKIQEVKRLSIFIPQDINEQIEALLGKEETLLIDLELSVRSHNCLSRAGLKTLKDITSKTEEELMKIRNLGRKSCKEIKQKVHELGLKLKDEDLVNEFLNEESEDESWD